MWRSLSSPAQGPADERLIVTSVAKVIPMEAEVRRPSDASSARFPESDLEEELCGMLAIKKAPCKMFHASRNATGSASISSGPLTCTATWKFEDSEQPNETHALVAFSGVEWFVHAYDLEFCALVRCFEGKFCLFPDPYDIKDFSTAATFQHAKISGTFSRPNEIIFPMMAASGGQIRPRNEVFVDTRSASLEIVQPSTIVSLSLFVPFNYTVPPAL